MLPVSCLDVQYLPPEIWCEAARQAPPLGIIALSQTCKYLRLALNNRSLWISCLEDMCRAYQLFTPSFPVGIMDLAHIQRVTCGPYLWRSLISKHSAAPRDIHQAARIQPRSKEIVSGLGANDVTFISIVPGGRFVLAVPQDLSGGQDAVTINLWDLGAPGSLTQQPPSLLATNLVGTSHGHRHPALIIWEPELARPIISPQGDSLRILLQVSNGGRITPMSFILVAISLIEQSVSLKEIAAVKMLLWTGGQRAYTRTEIIGDRLIICAPNVIVVWNFIEGTSCVRHIDLRSVPSPEVMKITDSFLVLISDGEIEAWDIPQNDQFSPVVEGVIDCNANAPSWYDRAPPDYQASLEWYKHGNDIETSMALYQRCTSLPVVVEAFFYDKASDPNSDESCTFLVRRYSINLQKTPDVTGSQLQVESKELLSYRVPILVSRKWARPFQERGWKDPLLRCIHLAIIHTASPDLAPQLQRHRCVYADVDPLVSSSPNQLNDGNTVQNTVSLTPEFLFANQHMRCTVSGRALIEYGYDKLTFEEFL